MLVDGGFNGWFLAPSTQDRTIELAFSPQRTLRFSQLITALGVLACLLFLGLDRRPRLAPVISRPQLLAPWLSTSRRDGLELTISATAIGMSVIATRHGLIVGAIVAGAALGLRRARLCGLVGLGWFAWIAFKIVTTVHNDRPAAYFGWPANWERYHRPTLAAVLLIAIAAMSALHDDRDGGD